MKNKDINDCIIDFVSIFIVGLVVVSAYQVSHRPEVLND